MGRPGFAGEGEGGFASPSIATESCQQNDATILVRRFALLEIVE
jgi:hypothetical protein